MDDLRELLDGIITDIPSSEKNLLKLASLQIRAKEAEKFLVELDNKINDVEGANIYQKITRKISEVSPGESMLTTEKYYPFTDNILLFWLKQITKNDVVLDAFKSFLIQSKLSLTDSEISELAGLEKLHHDERKEIADRKAEMEDVIKSKKKFVENNGQQLVEFKNRKVNFVFELFNRVNSILRSEKKVDKLSLEDRKFVFCVYSAFPNYFNIKRSGWFSSSGQISSFEDFNKIEISISSVPSKNDLIAQFTEEIKTFSALAAKLRLVF